MIRELFSNVIAANRILMNTEDFPFIYKLEEILDRLPPYTVSETGCLQRCYTIIPRKIFECET